MHRHNRQTGVTILELMISVAILAIVVAVVVPGGQSILIQNRIISEINETSAIVQFARNHAIDEQIDTVVCPSADFATCGADWNNPKIVFADADGDGDRGANETLLATSSIISEVNVMTGPVLSIRFQGNGMVGSPATLLLCHENQNNQYARSLTISLQGRVKMSQDTNNDGVHEDNQGLALDCT